VVTKIFVKLKFADFTRTTVERVGRVPSLGNFAACSLKPLRAQERVCG
jgi:hypothetical protein